jgi:putative ABC transport system substrate-binding protein
MIGRREFITLLGGAAATWPLVARAQQPAMPTIGLLAGQGANDWRWDAMRRGLSEAGYAEGRNITIVRRWAEGKNERLPELAADLVHRQVDAIAVTGIPAAKAAQAATKTIPIVFGMGGDPVEFGLVPRLNRPGGNITGMSTLNVELTPKRLELLHQAVPTASMLGLLVDPTNPNAETVATDARKAAAELGLQIQIAHASSGGELDAAFTALTRQRVGALVISNAGIFNDHSDELGALALSRAMPAIFQSRGFAAAGGLMSYGDNTGDLYRQVGLYVGRILKGEKPGDLPVQRFTRTGLIINLNTAKSLGLSVPITLLGRADEVIE